MAKVKFTMSDMGKSEYCCTIVRVGEVTPIEGSDFLGVTYIAGNSLVVRKDQVKEGDILFYASNETVLDKNFLSANNLFEIGAYELNSNAEIVSQLRAEGKMEDAKRICGFFNKHGRVRMIRLRGVPSMGFLFTKEDLSKVYPDVMDMNLEDLVNTDFDTINGDLFIKVYVPYTPPRRGERNRSQKRQKKVERFDRMIPGEFFLHYDTNPLGKNMHRLSPDTIVDISVKLHGTSIVLSNVKVKVPKKLPIHKWMWNKFVDLTGLFKSSRIIDYTVEYGNVYSTRNVIRNQYINKKVGDGFYKVDVWGATNEIMKPYIDKGMTLYGEVCGYVTGTQTYVQKDYDYGCSEGCHFLMPYRITSTEEGGSKREWSVDEVNGWTNTLLMEHPELKPHLRPMEMLYHGTLHDLYPDMDVESHWHENVLLALKNEKSFLMEQDEPLCKNKVPREGICVRLNDSVTPECFKLKCDKFFLKERDQMDKGHVDIEMTEGYGDEESVDEVLLGM